MRSTASHGPPEATVHPTGKTPAVLLKKRANCPVPRAKIYVFPKDRSYDLKKPARLDTGDVRPSSPDVRRVAMDAVAPQDVRWMRVRSSRVVLSRQCRGQAP